MEAQHLKVMEEDTMRWEQQLSEALATVANKEADLLAARYVFEHNQLLVQASYRLYNDLFLLLPGWLQYEAMLVWCSGVLSCIAHFHHKRFYLLFGQFIHTFSHDAMTGSRKPRRPWSWKP